MHSLPTDLNPFVLILSIGIVLGVVYGVGVVTRTQELVRLKLRRCAAGLLLYAASVLLMSARGYSVTEVLAFSFLLALTPLWLIRGPRRTRHIPAHIRRTVIARDLKGDAFDPNIHHIDHIVPFSKGGDHSLRNLRVVYKDDNLRKGARMPRLRELLPND